MSYSTLAHAMISYVECHLDNFSLSEMSSLIGYWDDTENMLKNLSSRSVREKLGELIDCAKGEDTLAYDRIKTLLNQI